VTLSERGRTVPAPIARLRSELEALDGAYSKGHHGLWSARRRAELVDAALIELYLQAGSGPRTALVAMGGYGRGTLAPASDIDLMIVHDGTDQEAVARLADHLLYPMWDAGLEVGHAVRTLKESSAAAAERLDSLASLLDARYLVGDEALSAQIASDPLAFARKDERAFARELRADADARHERYGSAAHLLEPELKLGAGGLRDIHCVGWLQLVVGHGLEDLGLLTDRDRSALDSAEEFLTRVRSALQLDTGKRTDRLLLEEQPVIAEVMGFVDQPRLTAVDGLMRAVFEHARDVSYVFGAIFDRYLVDASSIAQSHTKFRNPEAALIALAEIAEREEAMPPASLAGEHVDPALSAEVWSDQTRDAFLRILRSGDAGVAALETLDRLGVLAILLPEWAEVRCRPQRDPYHRFTVDAHLSQTLAEMGRMLDAGDDDDPIERTAALAASDRDALLLGALLHDIGKVGEGSHVDVGARLAASALARMRLPAATAQLAEFMVAEHLLLPDTATRRDLSDDDLILSVAAKVGKPERLGALYLLAKADALATGPAAWTLWRSTLVAELVVRVQRTFDRGDMGQELAERLTDRIDRLRDLLGSEPEPEVDRFVWRMPRGYFLTVEPARMARHYSTIASAVGANEVRTASATGTRPGTYELLVVAVDRPGLLSWIAGALSLAGLSIRSAQIFTTEDGVAVDLFDVVGAWEPEVGDDRWRIFRRTLRGTIEGTVSISRRIQEQRRHYPAAPSGMPVSIKVDDAASDFFTVIEVGAPDRVGLLYDITSALADLQLDVHLAKVATYTGRVVDSFYVQDPLGRKISDPAHVAEIEEAVRSRAG
jgi:[protein-PII] uridylyltransferase